MKVMAANPREDVRASDRSNSLTDGFSNIGVYGSNSADVPNTRLHGKKIAKCITIAVVVLFNTALKFDPK